MKHNNDQHETYIRRCFDLANLAKNNVGRNPNVGALLVHHNKIIGEGYYKSYGDIHAEDMAIREASKQYAHLISDATLYISLEPCNNYSKRPPCTGLILENKIKKVVISCLDPNPEMSGNSIKHLIERGVEVIDGILKKEGLKTIRFFETTITKKRPYIYLKFAQDKNFMMGHKDRQVWITSELAKIESHKLRTEVDAIMIGVQTANTDDPQLTARAYQGPSPLRVVIDPNARLSKESKLLTDEKDTWIFTDQNLTERNKQYIQLLGMRPDEHIEQIVAKLYDAGKSRILVEGGAKTLNHFIQNNLWDECMVITSKIPKDLNIKAPTIIGEWHKKRQLGDEEIHWILNKI